MSWTRARTNSAMLRAARRAGKTTGLVVDKLLRLGEKVSIQFFSLAAASKTLFFQEQKGIKNLLGGM